MQPPAIATRAFKASKAKVRSGIAPWASLGAALAVPLAAKPLVATFEAGDSALFTVADLVWEIVAAAKARGGGGLDLEVVRP